MAFVTFVGNMEKRWSLSAKLSGSPTFYLAGRMLSSSVRCNTKNAGVKIGT